jgi:hypothetical protein
VVGEEGLAHLCPSIVLRNYQRLLGQTRAPGLRLLSAHLSLHERCIRVGGQALVF